MSTGKDKAIWLFGGGPMQKPVVDRIKERGYKLILTDKSDAPYCLPFADEFVHLDLYDLEGNAKAAEGLRERFDIKAAMAAGIDACEGPAVVAKKLGIHGVDPAIARIYRYKNEHRKILAAAGIPQPWSTSAATFDEAKKIIAEHGLPACFKSTNNAGSRGFSALRKDSDVTEGAFNLARTNGTTGLVVVEELLQPTEDEIAEQSLETLWYDGAMYWLNWVDRPFRTDMKFFPGIDASRYRNLNWGVEIGHLNPAVHSPHTLDSVRDMVYKAGVALGLSGQSGGHIMKCDIMLTKKGPYILEPTLRLSGGWDSAGSTPARGGDFIGGAIEMALGNALTPELFYKHFVYRYPDLQVAVLTDIPDGAENCIGRSFALATGATRQEALKHASENLAAEKYLG